MQRQVAGRDPWGTRDRIRAMEAQKAHQMHKLVSLGGGHGLLRGGAAPGHGPGAKSASESPGA